MPGYKDATLHRDHLPGRGVPQPLETSSFVTATICGDAKQPGQSLGPVALELGHNVLGKESSAFQRNKKFGRQL